MPVAPIVHPSSLTWLGLSHEVAQGTPALSATSPPTWVLPLDASSFDPEDKPKWLRDIALRGSQAELFAMVQGVSNAAWSLSGPVYPGITPVLLDNMFGDVTTTPTGGTFAASGTLAAGGYVRNSTGLSLTTTAAPTGFTAAGVIGKIVSGGIPAYNEYFVTTGAAVGDVIPLAAPLHYTYPAGSTVTYATANPTKYSHLFASLNAFDGQPSSWTLLDASGVTDVLNGTILTDADPFGQRVYTTMCLAQLDFTISAEAMFTQKASGTSWISSPTSQLPSPPTGPYAIPANSVTTVPVPSWSSQIKLTLPDVAFGVVNYVGEVTFSLKRKLQVYWTDDGSQNPYTIARGPLGVTGTVKAAVAQDEQILQSMLKNFQGQLQATVTVPSVTPYLAGEQGLVFQFDVQKAAFTAAKPTRSQVLVGYDSTFEGVANTTNVGQTGGLGPITVTCTDLNAQY